MPALPPTRPGCTTVRRARPLPDPAAVRLCLIPDPAPPFDGEAPSGGEAPKDAEPPMDGEAPGTGPGSASVPPPGAAAEPGTSGTQRPAGATRPPGGGWPGRFAQVLAETLGGSRHPRQLVPWTSAQARDHIQRLGPQLSSPQQPRVRRVVTFSPTTDAMEMSVIVGFGSRVRALAVRLERQQPEPGTPAHGGAPPRWLCTAVEAA